MFNEVDHCKHLPVVIFVMPVSHPPSSAHSSSNEYPAALCMAPSTPPPPSSLEFAALTIPSISSFVMSPWYSEIILFNDVLTG